jgi:hypothetical protein
MMKTRYMVTAGAVFLCAALAVTMISSWLEEIPMESIDELVETSLNSAPTKRYEKIAGTWTYDCEFPVQHPETIMLTCADGGMLVTNIKWKSWAPLRAVGLGIYSQNMCDTDCAQGKRVEIPVRVILSEPVQYKGRRILRTLDISSVKGRELPNGTLGFSWDVSEFALMMNWNVMRP